jgi:hypothetical protein
LDTQVSTTPLPPTESRQSVQQLPVQGQLEATQSIIPLHATDKSTLLSKHWLQGATGP